MNNQAYKEVVSNYVLNFKPTQISQKMLFEIYEQLKELSQDDLTKVFRLIEYIKTMIINENHQKRMNSQLTDELLKDIKEVIKAHQRNMKMLGYSPLIGFIFNYYVYVKYCNNNNSKSQKLIKPLEDELNTGTSDYLRNSNDRIVKKFYRLSRIRLYRVAIKNIKNTEISVSEKRKNIVKDNVEMLYKKKIYKDTFQIVFIKILVEAKLLSFENANQILKKIFGIDYYINENYLQRDEIKNLINKMDFQFSIMLKTTIVLFNRP